MRQSEMTVLIVDDEQPVLDYVAKHLRDRGYNAITAISGEAALGMIEQQSLRPAMLIADLVLPGMSGFALADAMREANPNLKTLFISGYTGAEYFRQMQVSTAGIPFLQKPFTPDALVQKVQELLSETAEKQSTD
jgi:two-component system, cell cycle sensor histidine kinase and response regulator CckA